MRIGRVLTVCAIAAALLLVTAQPARAQRTDDDSVTVTADNLGIFDCMYSVAVFNFGSVNANGDDFGTAGVIALGRNPTNTGGWYLNASGSITWKCSAAPVDTVRISLLSTAADHTTGSMADDDIEIRIQDTAGGTSTGWQLFTSLNDLITGMSVGNGVATAGGDLDLRLTVLDDDPLGLNTWVVRLRATGIL